MRDSGIMWFIYIAAGYLLGGIMFCKIIPLLLFKKDITELSDDKNPGAANVFIHCGVVTGLFCLALDILKGLLPVMLAERALDSEKMLFAAVICAPVLGHATAPFDRFRGGKCISTSFGVLLALLPQTRAVLLLAGLYILFSALRIQPHSRRSKLVFTLFGMISTTMLIIRGKPPLALGCAVISAAAVIKHSRLFTRTAE